MELPKYEDLIKEENEELLKWYRGLSTGWVKVGEKKYFMPSTWKEEGKNVFDYKTRPDDTWIVTHPRSGTTWTQEMVWLIRNDLDYKTAMDKLLVKRFPFFEVCLMKDEELLQNLKSTGPEIEKLCNEAFDVSHERKLAEAPSPRFIKTHLPMSFFPSMLKSGCKVVYVARNPKDVVVSWYYFHKSSKLFDFQGDFTQFLDYFLKGYTTWGPYSEHVKEGYGLRHDKNVLFLFYEEINKDLPATINKVAKFFGKSYSSEQVAELADYLHISNFRENSSVNTDRMGEKGCLPKGVLIRQGKRNAWKELITPEMEAKIDKWMEEKFKGSDLKFPFLED